MWVSGGNHFKCMATSQSRVDCDSAINTKDTLACRIHAGPGTRTFTLTHKQVHVHAHGVAHMHTHADECKHIRVHTYTPTEQSCCIANTLTCLLCRQSWVPLSFNKGLDCSEHTHTHTQTNRNTHVHTLLCTHTRAEQCFLTKCDSHCWLIGNCDVSNW